MKIIRNDQELAELALDPFGFPDGIVYPVIATPAPGNGWYLLDRQQLDTLREALDAAEPGMGWVVARLNRDGFLPPSPPRMTTTARWLQIGPRDGRLVTVTAIGNHYSAEVVGPRATVRAHNRDAAGVIEFLEGNWPWTA